ncbi:MAG: 16S rRNA (uracil(1498)-N(3))-methyltransferase [Kiritimatiellae bacterium]|nr:16S rRNA (uracil(1498)-N(3))-methyltransferase [Kiritimatiellia bacterium]
MNRILLEPHEVDPTGRARLSGRRAAHVFSVLNARPGDTVRVGLINGLRGQAAVLCSESDRMELECTFEPSPAPRPGIDLIMALPRPKTLKRLYAAVASLGVDRWWLVNAARVERNYFDTHVLDPGFIRERLVEGLEQSGDPHLPEVTVCRRLKPFLEDELDALCPPPEVRCLFHPEAAGNVWDLHHSLARQPRALLALGPEGGWVDYELELFARCGFQSVRIGSGRILRCDTAAIAALSVVDELRTSASAV